MKAISAPRTGIDAADRAERGVGPFATLGPPDLPSPPYLPQGGEGRQGAVAKRCVGVFPQRAADLGRRSGQRRTSTARPYAISADGSASVKKIRRNDHSIAAERTTREIPAIHRGAARRQCSACLS